MKKLLLLLFSFIMIFNFSQARGNRLKLMEDVPWHLEYSYNKYGEEDEIISAQCGQWAMKNRIRITSEGLTVSYETGWNSNLRGTVKQISFLFDSKREVIITNVEEVEYGGVVIGKAFFISKDNSEYINLIRNIKKSNYMSILIEDTEENADRITKVKNTDSYKIITAFENSLK